MPMSICTWNTQGNPTNDDDKLQILKSLWERCDVLLLQECGRLDISELEGVKEFIYDEPAGAYNIRCSTALISKRKARRIKTYYLQSSTGRSVLTAQIGDILVGTLHAQSGAGAVDAFQAASAMAVRGNFILGGDFNFLKWNVIIGSGGRRMNRRQINLRTKSRPLVVNHLTPSLPTHEKGGILDFFITSRRIRGRIERHHKRGGDHYPIILTTT